MKKNSLDISNEDFINIIISILNTDFEAEKAEIINYLDTELSKPERERDYMLIHECYLTLSEGYGHEYNNEYKKQAERQYRNNRIAKTLKDKLFGKAAMF